MPEPAAQPPYRPFSGRTFVAQFGQYETGSEQEPPADEILIGRERQRAYLIDLLMNMGRQGAYLVTGRRGSGKTSFVRHCISEYRSEVFERFQRSNVARGLLWDRTLILALVAAGIFGLLLLSELMEVLILVVSDAGEPQSQLAWLVIAPLLLACAYPMLYAKEVLEAVAAARLQEPTRDAQPSRLFAVVMAVTTAALAWRWGPFGAPALSMSRLFVSIAWMLLTIQIFSYRSTPFTPRSQDFFALLRGLLPHSFLGITTLPYLCFGIRLLGATPHQASDEYWANLGLGVLLVGGGLLLRGFQLFRAQGPPEELSKVMQLSFLWYALLGLLANLVGSFLLLQAVPGRAVWPLGLAVLALVVGVLRIHRLSRLGTFAFRPRPLHVLMAKALVSIVVALHLTYPVLSRLSPSGLVRHPMDDRSLHGGAHRLQGDPDRWRAAPVHADYLQQEISLHDQASPLETHLGSTLQTTAPEKKTHLLFPNKSEELCWILVFFLCALLIHYLEYEWLLRPFVRQRMDAVTCPGPPAPWEDQKQAGGLRRSWRDLAALTLSWALFRTWLPALVISVNLGFDRLDHRRVVHAMLVSLRDEYHRTFLAWNSNLANLGRLLYVLVLLLFVTIAGNQWFGLPDSGRLNTQQGLEVRHQATASYLEVCSMFKSRQPGPSVVHLLCSLPKGDVFFDVLYYDLLGRSTGALANLSPDHLLFEVVPYRRTTFPEVGTEALPVLLERGVHFRVYHLLIFVLFWWLGKSLFRRVPFLPYSQNLERIDSVLDQLSARTSLMTKNSGWQPARWLQGFFSAERVHQTQQDPVDPRTVEFALLRILQEIQAPLLHLPGARNQWISLPTPEITFIFDELDKLGTRSGPHGGEDPTGKQELEILDAERRRSVELHRLLADMKNVLSSAPARFIFVGGRNLHDEWLADQTARHPLLTSIFNAEVYLPSLLTDHEEVPEADSPRRPRLQDRIEEYVERQHWRARLLYRRWAKGRWVPAFGLPIRELDPPSFFQDLPPSPEKVSRELGALRRLMQLIILFILGESPGEKRRVELKLQDCLPADDLALKRDDSLAFQIGWGEDLKRDFTQFLTYRSTGNPKQLRELLALYVYPVERAVWQAKSRWSPNFDCRHVLRFTDIERFRLQLLADVYRHLDLTFEDRLVRRDDKVALSVFFLADFLFKFHRRAFSWSNLERVEELIHIHRTPDLREILEEIVESWSERFLHPIRNGMYAFRFRSDIAREVEYLSRQSAQEMAAFNFTLDESLALKSLYQSNIQRLEPTSRQELQDLVAGLGELHEFDQEYEMARLYYRRAIHTLDTELEQILGQGQDKIAKRPPVVAILSGEAGGLENARLYMTWGVARLRLMLQIGLTFEHGRNLERAAVEYRNARTLSRSLIRAMLGDPDAVTADRRLHLLKNLSLLFQPVFAEAWVAEKSASGVDTSISLAEKELLYLRTELPFVEDRELRLTLDPARVRSSNFALTVAELHNKTGDLYFYKGRQLASPEALSGYLESTSPGRSGSEGYLLRAHYHYAMGLHELRRFITHRRLSSPHKLNIWTDGRPRLPTIEKEGWPDYVFRSVGGNLNDLAETMLGRVSLFGLGCDLLALPAMPDGNPDQPQAVKDHHLVESFSQWLEEPRADAVEKDWPISLQIAGQSLPAGTLCGWLGAWRTDPNEDQVLGFEQRQGHGDLTRLLVSLNFTLVGAKYLERGGYLEDAASELLEVCETVTHYLWWNLALFRLWASRRADQKGVELPGEEPGLLDRACEKFDEGIWHHPYWRHLTGIATYALHKADRLFRRSRRAEGERGSYLVGDKIPPIALTLACSLGLVVNATFPSAPQENSGLLALVAGWVDLEKIRVADLPSILKASIIRHSYPMINRLQGLKVLIDNEVLTTESDRWQEREAVVIAWTLELLDLRKQFRSPLHFMPMQSGVTCALVDLRCRGKVASGWARIARDLPPGLDEIRRQGRADLKTSEEMYTMRRAYYEGISDLYYLFDDFNDRQIHFNIAMQMAGTEMVSLLQALLHAPEAPKNRPKPAVEELGVGELDPTVPRDLREQGDLARRAQAGDGERSMEVHGEGEFSSVGDG